MTPPSCTSPIHFRQNVPERSIWAFYCSRTGLPGLGLRREFQVKVFLYISTHPYNRRSPQFILLEPPPHIFWSGTPSENSQNFLSHFCPKIVYSPRSRVPDVRLRRDFGVKFSLYIPPLWYNQNTLIWRVPHGVHDIAQPYTYMTFPLWISGAIFS